MPSIQINPTQDKRILINVNSIDGTYPNYASVHDATAGTAIASTDATNNIFILYTAGFGFNFWQIARSFQDFDLSGLPVGAVITAATLNLNEAGTSTSELILIKGTFDSSLAVEDFDSFTGAGSGWSSGDVTTYSSAVDLDDDFNAITLNSTAITDIQTAFQAGERFKIVLMDKEYDYDDINISQGGSVELDFNTIDNADSAKHPFLELTYVLPIGGIIHLKQGKIKLQGGKFKFP